MTADTFATGAMATAAVMASLIAWHELRYTVTRQDGKAWTVFAVLLWGALAWSLIR